MIHRTKVELRKLGKRLPMPVKRTLAAVLDLGHRFVFALVRPYLLMRRARRREQLDVIAGAKQPVVLFLAPEAGLLPFFANHAILARTLQEAGHAAVMLSCDGLQPICSLKFAMQLKPTSPGNRSNPACQRCRERALRTGHEYGLLDVSLESLIGEAEQAQIQEIMSAHADAYWTTTHDGIAFGASALGEALRDRRKMDAAEFTPEDHELLQALLFSTLAIYLAVNKLAKRYAIKRIAYFGDYAYWIPVQVLAQRQGIGINCLDHAHNLDVDHRFIGLRPGNANAHMLQLVDQWDAYRDLSIDPGAVAKVADSALYRLRGHGGVSTYSPNWVRDGESLLEQLGLSRDRKTIVAYTSSTDELLCIREYLGVLGKPYAHGPKPFADQVAWLRALVDWVATRTDLQLVVRQHPRMAPGHRHASAASQFAQMQREFAQVPPNVVMIWPDSKVSSYNLAELADVALVAWSNMALELSRFGVPVVAAFPNIAPYPFGSFVGFADNPKEYFLTIEAALARGARFDLLTDAFRWSHFLTWSPVVDVSDLVPEFNYNGIPRWHPPKHRETILKVLVGDEDICRLNTARLAKGGAAEAAEREALLRAVDRFIHFFMVGFDPGVRPLVCDVSVEPGGAVSAVVEGRAVRRRSPLVHRLADMRLQSIPADGRVRIGQASVMASP
jgi:hypothetical protein